MKTLLNRLIVALAAVGLFAGSAAAQLKVVTSTTDLHSIAKEVGGDKIKATHIGQGYQDPHFIEAKPSYILQLRNADVWAYVGLDLEAGWMPLLLQGARNPKIQKGGSGHVDASRAIRVLDVPAANVDRSAGDVHALGNPHYWLHPDNGRRIARMFRDKFSELDPKNASTYARNTADFEKRLDAAEKTWALMRNQMKGKSVVAWHTSWRYLAYYTGISIVAFIEPKPGVPPSPAHLATVIETIKRTGAKVIIMEPFYDRKTADLVAARTGAKVLVLPASVGGAKNIQDYFALLGNNIAQLAGAI